MRFELVARGHQPGQIAGACVDVCDLVAAAAVEVMMVVLVNLIAIRLAWQRDHIHDSVSNVEGMLKDGMRSMDVLRATFPAGTLTGAPKVHAMELIDELEPVKRGIYGGACGYLSFAGDMDVAIAIRTGIIKNQTLYVQAAAGVVADSVPEMEWRETEHKARALLRASELVEEGLE